MDSESMQGGKARARGRKRNEQLLPRPALPIPSMRMSNSLPSECERIGSPLKRPGKLEKRSRESGTLQNPVMDKLRRRERVKRKRNHAVPESRPSKRSRSEKGKVNELSAPPHINSPELQMYHQNSQNKCERNKSSLDTERSSFESSIPKPNLASSSVADRHDAPKNEPHSSLYERIINRGLWVEHASSLSKNQKAKKTGGNFDGSAEVERDATRSNEHNQGPTGHAPVKSDVNGGSVVSCELRNGAVSNESEEEIWKSDVEGEESDKGMGELDSSGNSINFEGAGRDDTFELEIHEVQKAEEGENNWENSSDFDGEEDLLLLAMKAQERRYTQESPRERSAAGVASILKNRHLSQVSNRSGPLNMNDEWQLEYQGKPPFYFTSQIAKMEIDQKVIRTATGQHKATSYAGVKLNEKNNADVAFVFEQEYETATQGDRSKMNSYHNFTTCVGQLARVGIALGKLSQENLWKPGQFFKVAGNISFFQYFVKYFSHTSTPATVMNKVAQLVKFVDCALAYFDMNPRYGEQQVKNMTMRAKIKSVARFLRRDRSVNKARAMKIRQNTKEDWHRSTTGKFIDEEMFDYMRSVAIDALHGILNTASTAFARKGALDIASKRRTFYDMALKSTALLRKWCVNFTALLLLYGNGQRPQVYGKLKCPSVADMLLFTEEQGDEVGAKPLLIEIDGLEKRDRSSKLPFLMLDPIVAKYVDFQVQFIVPYLLQKHSIPSGSKDSQKLLLDTRNGHGLNTDNVRNTLRSWIKAVDPELHITPMDLRSSYCTIMIRRHVHRNELNGNADFTFQNLSESEFKEMLACVMNTSVEQINSVYAAASYSDYSTQVAQIMNICKPTNHLH